MVNPIGVGTKGATVDSDARRVKKMDAEDFQDLYKLLRGSRCAVFVLDARALFVESKLDDSLVKMKEARASFAESRHRVLRHDPEKGIDPKAQDFDRQVKKARRKQEKAQETLDAFDEILPKLSRLAERQASRRARQAGSEPVSGLADRTVNESDAATQVDAGDQTDKHSGQGTSNGDDAGLDSYSDFESMGEGDLSRGAHEVVESDFTGPQRPAYPGDFSDEFLGQFAACVGDAKLDLIGASFGFRPVENELDVVGDGVYLIQTSKRTMLVVLPEKSCEANELHLINLVDRKRIKPITRVTFLDLGMRRKMVLLTCAETAGHVSEVFARDFGSENKMRPPVSETGDTKLSHETVVGEPGTVVDE